MPSSPGKSKEPKSSDQGREGFPRCHLDYPPGRVAQRIQTCGRYPALL